MPMRMLNDSKLFVIYIFLTTNNCYETLLLCLEAVHIFSSMKYQLPFLWPSFLLNLLLSSFYLRVFWYLVPNNFQTKCLC